MLPAIATLVGFAPDDVQTIRSYLRDDEKGVLGKFVYSVVGSPERKKKGILNGD